MGRSGPDPDLPPVGALVPASGALWPLFTRSHFDEVEWTPAGFYGDR